MISYSMTYDRTVDDDFKDLLGPGGTLHGIATDPGRVLDRKTNRVVQLDLQLRCNNEVHIYAGLTKLLTLRLSDRRMIVRAHSTYENRYEEVLKTTGSGLRPIFGSYALNELKDFEGRYRDYIETIAIDTRWLAREGFWQAWLAWRYGRKFAHNDPFVVIDAQAVIEFGKGKSRNKTEFINELNRNESKRLSCAFKDPRISNLAPKMSASTSILARQFGDELDLLGVTRDGDLALIEVKSGHDAKGVYLSPFQLGVYETLWNSIADQGRVRLRDAVNRLIEQKIEIGLLPSIPAIPHLRDDFQIVPILAVGDPNFRSASWARMDSLRESRGQMLEAEGINNPKLWFVARKLVNDAVDSPAKPQGFGSSWEWISSSTAEAMK